MSSTKHLLIVSHAPSANTRALTEAVASGASHPDIKGIDVRVEAPLHTGAPAVLWAHGIIVGTTENFGYMSGALKDFFDRVYYPCLDHTQGIPYSIFIRAGNDGTGAQSSIQRIVTGLRWRAIHDPVIVAGDFKPKHLQQGEELGMTMAAGLEAGIF